MNDFKGRTSSRFSRNGGKSNAGTTSTRTTSTRSSGPSRSTSTPERSSNGGGYARGGSKDKSYAFTRIGSITVPKSVGDDVHDFIMQELRGNRDVRFNVQVYLPKGAESLTLANKDNLVISFGVSDKDKDFVVGHLLLPNNSSNKQSSNESSDE
jgi:hypothetical protein